MSLLIGFISLGDPLARALFFLCICVLGGSKGGVCRLFGCCKYNVNLVFLVLSYLLLYFCFSSSSTLGGSGGASIMCTTL